jgi:CheY-like chemotaxis protein
MYVGLRRGGSCRLFRKMRHVLIIEDDSSVRSTIRFLLERQDFFVDEAENGQAGLERAHQHRPDLILCDLDMPVMDGFETLTRLSDTNIGDAVELLLRRACSQSRGARNHDGNDLALVPPVDPEIINIHGDHTVLGMQLAAIGKRHQESGIGDAFHGLVNPFREERSGAPLTVPANRMNGCPAPVALAFSSCWRINSPWEIPEVAAVSSSHRAKSFGIRTVIV